MENKHPDHSKQLARLNRISGQIEGIKKMIQDNRYCPDILMQISAVRSALKSLEANILEPHIRCCVKKAIGSSSNSAQEKAIGELLEIFIKNKCG